MVTVVMVTVIMVTVVMVTENFVETMYLTAQLCRRSPHTGSSSNEHPVSSYPDPYICSSCGSDTTTVHQAAIYLQVSSVAR